MRRNHKRTTSHERKVLAFSLFIFISAVLFALIVQWIVFQPAHAEYHDAEIVTTASTQDRIVCVVPPKEHRLEDLSTAYQSISPELPGEQEFLNDISNVSTQYPDVPTEVIRAMIWYESRFQPNVHNGLCVGLMQVSMKWHANRAARLGVTDFYDPYSNILLGVDYLNEILSDCGDLGLALMIYNGDSRAYDLYSVGQLSDYADGILTMAHELSGGE